MPPGRKATAGPRVLANPAERRYELWLGDWLAGQIEYSLAGDVVAMTRAELAAQLRGGRLGERLVHDALEDVRLHGGSVRPLCPLVAGYLQLHPEYQHLVAA